MGQELVVVDVGNSSVKVAMFAPPERDVYPVPIRLFRVKAGHWGKIPLPFSREPHTWHIGSVHRPSFHALLDWIQRHRPQDTIHVIRHTDLGLEIELPNPSAAGIDRLAAATAANMLRHPDRPALVIDAGTTITLDVISADGVFLGGSIAPGHQMRLDAMHRGTDKLPAVSASNLLPPMIGKDTVAAMRAGAFWSLVTHIEGICARIQDQLGARVDTFATGGDAEPIIDQLSLPLRFEPHLVLSGLATAQP